MQLENAHIAFVHNDAGTSMTWTWMHLLQNLQSAQGGQKKEIK
jgi:hypothetical protein